MNGAIELTDALQRETDALARSWEQHSEEVLDSYLVEAEQDPRINLQSILARHFILEQLFPAQFEVLKREELVFGGVLKELLWIGVWIL